MAKYIKRKNGQTYKLRASVFQKAISRKVMDFLGLRCVSRSLLYWTLTKGVAATHPFWRDRKKREKKHRNAFCLDEGKVTTTHPFLFKREKSAMPTLYIKKVTFNCLDEGKVFKREKRVLCLLFIQKKSLSIVWMKGKLPLHISTGLREKKTLRCLLWI